MRATLKAAVAQWKERLAPNEEGGSSSLPGRANVIFLLIFGFVTAILIELRVTTRPQGVQQGGPSFLAVFGAVSRSLKRQGAALGARPCRILFRLSRCHGDCRRLASTMFHHQASNPIMKSSCLIMQALSLQGLQCTLSVAWYSLELGYEQETQLWIFRN